MEFAEIYRCLAGDTSDIWDLGFQLSADDEPLVLAPLDANFTCTVAVEGTAISRAVTLKNAANDRFRIALTASETATLEKKQDYVVNLKISNATLSPPLAKTKQVLLRIS
jgi:hypothetical protein